jgi:peptidoglycan/xylan/chitin deacetylase (PgdA/CDA1 family)
MFHLIKLGLQQSCLFLSFLAFLACSNQPSKETDPVSPSADSISSPAHIEPLFLTNVHALNFDSNKTYIYLTFDDGPQHGTVNCINICRQEGVKASFFMVGVHQQMKSDGKQIVAIIRNGYPQNLLANHSYDHANGKYKYFYQHPQMALADFLRTQDSLMPLPKIIRLPGNNAWVRNTEIKASRLVRPVTSLLDSAGFNVIGWDMEWNFDHKSARPVQRPDSLAAHVDTLIAHGYTHLPKHLVILTHDRMFQRSPDSLALVQFIQLVKRNPNYVFETVDHYPGLKK